MLRHIHERRLLYFSSKTHLWEWSIDKIREEISVSDNVVEFLSRKLSTLPTTTVTSLQLAACLGTTVNISLVESLLPLLDDAGHQTYSVQAALEVAEEANLIEISPDRTRLKFSHDRVTAAAYDLIPDGQIRKSLHLRIGRYFRDLTDQFDDSTAPDKDIATQRHLGLTVTQLNLGSDLMDDEGERTGLAHLNLLAAKQTMKTSAFKLAGTFLEIGLGLLDSHRWEKEYELTLQLNTALASVLFSNGRMEETIVVVTEIYDHGRRPEDRFDAQFIHAQALYCSNRLNECLDVGLRTLKDLGHPGVPRKPRATHILGAFIKQTWMLKGKSDDHLLNLPVLTDAKQLRILRQICDMGLVAYLAGVMDLIPILNCSMMGISLRLGISGLAPLAFAQYGFVLSVLNDFNGAFRFAMLALRLMDRFGEDPRATYYVNLLRHLKKPIHDSVNAMLHVYHTSFSRGDMKYAGQACIMNCGVRFESGLSLDSLLKDGFAFCRQLQK